MLKKLRAIANLKSITFSPAQLVLALGVALLLAALAVPGAQALDRTLRTGIAQRSVQILPLLFSDDGELLDIPWSGSGTIISPSGLILTNYHVVAETGDWNSLGVSITQRIDQPPQPAFQAYIVAASPALDLAVLQIYQLANGDDVEPEDLNLPYVEIGDADILVLGDELNVFGYPGIGGSTITYTQGQVSGFNPQEGIEYERAWIKTNTTISGGNSGGTAVDEEGLLVGVPTSAGSGAEGNVTDCRVVQDTNGDGFIDGNDSCTPIGGFLNSLRPINLAYPLIQSAVTGEPPEDFGLDEPDITSLGGGAGVTISGQIVDADTGRPVPDAYFIVLQPGVAVDDFLEQFLDEQIAAIGVSDRSGYYDLLPPLPYGQVYSALILAEGYEPILEDDALEITDDWPEYVEFDPIAIVQE